MKNTNKINIGILGYGNIGSSVASLISRNSKTIKQKSGLELKVAAVADPKVKGKIKHAEKVIDDPSIDVIVEAIGGTKPALSYILRALNSGKHVVTSNKEVVAMHADEILQTARDNNVSVFFEAAVGGGIPILQPLRESLYANNIYQVYGIVNGTTNFILSKMTEEGWDFNRALAEAQDKGYAEANPKNDVEGYDAAYKAVILTLMAFGVLVDFSKVYFEGITKITKEDIAYAGEIGYVIKLLAVAKQDNGEVEVHVHPVLVPAGHPLSSVSGPMNAIYVLGDAVGELMFYGQGAGGNPTASAIVNDIVAACHGTPSQRSAHLKMVPRDMSKTRSRYYVRMTVPDKPGVLAQISKVFSQEQVSIQTVLQKESHGRSAPLVIILHEVVEANFNRALSKIKKLSVVQKVDNVIRVGL